MTKSKLFLDFDSTLCQTIHSVCRIYSDKYKHHNDFVIPHPCLETTWNFHTQCPLFTEEEIEEVFNDETMFEYLRPFPNAVDVLRKLEDYYQIIIVSVGSYENISLKCKYIKENFDFVDDFIGIINKGCVMDKSIINMRGTNMESPNIFIDDSQGNLFSQHGSSNLIRYCYAHNGLITEWNEDWLKMGGRNFTNWLEVEKELMRWI